MSGLQVTGEEGHEWIGIVMTTLVIIHQILNRKWYGAIFRGKYNAYRTAVTAVDILLLLSFVLTAFCGMSMSGYAVPFLYGMAKVSFVRRTHLTMSHWSFILMGLHLGLHIPFADRSLTLLFVGTIFFGTGLQSVHGGENEHEPICYRRGYQGTAGKEQNDTASAG